MISGLQKIKAILDTIPSTDLGLSFEYLKSQPSSFPAGCVLSNGFTEEILDSANNLITELFEIRLIFPQDESLIGQEKWVNLTDLISTEFRKSAHQTLDGTAIAMIVKQGLPPEFSADYAQPVIVFKIVIEAKIIKAIN